MVKFAAKLILAAMVVIGSMGQANADVIVLQDNFNSENGGNGKLNFASFTNWNVVDGTVDLIGNGYFDFYPGNGLYVDLDGTSLLAGILESKLTFAAGDYKLAFDLGGSARGSAETVQITLGNFSASITLQATDTLAPVVLTFSTSGGTLDFHNLGGDNIGAILDNVVLTAVGVPVVPEPSSMALMGLGGVSLLVAAYRRRQAA